MQRPQKLCILPQEVYPTERLTSDKVDDKDIKLVENMSEMAEFVYNLYMSKMEEMKGTLPTEEELRAMHKQLPNEDDEDNVGEVDASPNEANEEPPQKRVAKESSTKTAEGFKPTPIVNEIYVEEDTEMEQKEEKTEKAEEPAVEEPPQTSES